MYEVERDDSRKRKIENVQKIKGVGSVNCEQ